MNQWNPAAKVFHWLVVLLFVVTAGMGVLADSQAMSPTKLQLFVTHKSLGLTVLAVMLFRLAWRGVSTAPTAHAGLSLARRRLAGAGHASLYVLLIALPVSGWLLTSAANFPYRWFGWFEVPLLWPEDKAMQELAEFAHHNLFYLLLLLVIGHALIAFWHAHKGLPILARMFPARPSPVWFLLLLALTASAALLLARSQSYDVSAAGTARSASLKQSTLAVQAPIGASQRVGNGVDRELAREIAVVTEFIEAGEGSDKEGVPTKTVQDSSMMNNPSQSPATPIAATGKSESENTTVTSDTSPISRRQGNEQAQPEKSNIAPTTQKATDPPQWIMQREKSNLRFVGSYTGADFTGEFTRFEPFIRFDPDNMQGAIIDVEVDVSSATLGSADMDAVLPDPEWFYFARYPGARFTATRFAKSDDTFFAYGELMLKGHVRPVTLELDWSRQGPNNAQLRASAIVSRIAFGIGSGEWAEDESIGFDVRVEAELALERGD